MNETLNLPVIGSLKKEAFCLWFIVAPMFFVGIHLGIIITHIYLNYSFSIPSFLCLTSVLSSIWTWIGLLFYLNYFDSNKTSNTLKEKPQYDDEYWFVN